MTFDEQKKYVRSVNKLDGHKFSKATDITNMIDLLNQENEKENKKRGDNEIHEISKYLANIQGRKMFMLGGK